MYVNFLHIGRIRMDTTTQRLPGTLDKTCKASNASMFVTGILMMRCTRQSVHEGMRVDGSRRDEDRCECVKPLRQQQ
jgi:hypothetical protein